MPQLKECWCVSISMLFYYYNIGGHLCTCTMSGNYNEYMSWRRMLILVFSSLSSFFIPTYEYEREREEKKQHMGVGATRTT